MSIQPCLVIMRAFSPWESAEPQQRGVGGPSQRPGLRDATCLLTLLGSVDRWYHDPHLSTFLPGVARSFGWWIQHKLQDSCLPSFGSSPESGDYLEQSSPGDYNLAMKIYGDETSGEETYLSIGLEYLLWCEQNTRNPVS